MQTRVVFKPLDHVPAVIGGMIIEDDHFDWRVSLFENGPDPSFKEPGMVVVGNDDGDGCPTRPDFRADVRYVDQGPVCRRDGNGRNCRSTFRTTRRDCGR